MLNEITIRDGTTLIAENVFYDQEHMIDFVLPNSLKYINVAAQDGGLGIDDVCLSDSARKVIVNDQIYILRGDNMYTITGQEVR